MSTYITPDDIADRFSVTSKTVRSWLRSGELVGIKIGKNWRINETDLNRYLDGQRLKVLLERAREKHPHYEWSEDTCAECGEAIAAPNSIATPVCSPECKVQYDSKVNMMIGSGEDAIFHHATVVPPY